MEQLIQLNEYLIERASGSTEKITPEEIEQIIKKATDNKDYAQQSNQYYHQIAKIKAIKSA